MDERFDWKNTLLGLAAIAGFVWLLLIDLELALVVAAVLSGLIWLGYWLFSRKTASPGVEEPVAVEYARSFFPVLIAVLVLRSFVAEPFRIPSGSMLPTLEIGDFILVNKFAYGLRLPLIHTKILETGTPQRGDVVVFRFPNNPDIDYIKRLVAVPGDKVVWDSQGLRVNGEDAQREMDGNYLRPDQKTPPALRLKETLSGVTHDILITNTTGRIHGGGFAVPPAVEFTVPEGQYFMVGDNRDNSNDSRFWGFVPEANLVGKATYVWMHYHIRGDGFNFRRVGNAIH